jgi:hypothetical protein
VSRRIRTWAVAIAILAVAGAGCGGLEFEVFVKFPDQQALDEASSLRVFVVVPMTEMQGCFELVQGAVEPGDTGYDIETQASENLTSPGGPLKLYAVGKGRRLFFAEAEDGDQMVFLLGCTDLPEGKEGRERVVINLQRD